MYLPLISVFDVRPVFASVDMSKYIYMYNDGNSSLQKLRDELVKIV